MPALEDLLLRIAQLPVTVAQRAGSVAISIARKVAPAACRSDADDDVRAGDRYEPVSSPPQPQPQPSEQPAEPAVPTPPEAAAAAPAPAAAPPPAHVDREAVVVAEFADPGAEDGPGPQIRVDEPWKGYGELTAKQVIAELQGASPAALAVARLYEPANRARRTVIEAIDRKLAQ